MLESFSLMGGGHATAATLVGLEEGTGVGDTGGVCSGAWGARAPTTGSSTPAMWLA